MTIATDSLSQPISLPTVTYLPATVDSAPTILEPYHVDLLPEYDYEQREYLVSGTAVGAPFCTRLLLRCPRDVGKFSGLVVTETSHIWSGTSVWRASNRWIMRNGHAWMEVDSQSPVAIGVVKASNPNRYQTMTFLPGPLAKDFKDNIPFTPNPTRQTLEDEYTKFMEQWWAATPQSPEVLVAASAAVRSGEMGLRATRVFLSGISQTGGVTRRFITHSSHLRLPDGGDPYNALIPAASGGPALPDPSPGVKVIELLGEAEFQSVRWSCGVSGQTRGVSHRRPDSDSFRLYEVAGMAHRESRYFSASDKNRWDECDLGGAEWSTFPNSFVYAAVFEAADRWTRKDNVPPPSSKVMETLGESDELVRDEYGNAMGGVRSLHTEVPTSRVVAATPMGRPSWYCGSEWKFSQDRLRQLYGTVANYRHQAGVAIGHQVAQGFLLPCDAETLRLETVEKVQF